MNFHLFFDSPGVLEKNIQPVVDFSGIFALLGLLRPITHLAELRIQTAVFKQLLMPSRFDYPSVFKDKDIVGAHYGRESVSDDDYSAASG